MPVLTDRTLEFHHPDLEQHASKVFEEMVKQTKDLISSYYGDYYHDSRYLGIILSDTVEDGATKVTFWHGASQHGTGTHMSRAPFIIERHCSHVYRYTLEQIENGYWSLTITKVK